MILTFCPKLTNFTSSVIMLGRHDKKNYAHSSWNFPPNVACHQRTMYFTKNGWKEKPRLMEATLVQRKVCYLPSTTYKSAP